MCLVDGNRQPSEFASKVPRSDVALRDFVYFLIPEHGMSIKKVMALCDSLPGDRCVELYFDAHGVCSQARVSAWTEKKTPTFGENPKQVSNSQTNVGTPQSPFGWSLHHESR